MDASKAARLRSLERSFPEGTTLFRKGDTSREMYILLEGEVEIVVEGERVALEGRPGTYLGEMSTLLGEPRSATVRTTKPSKFVVVNAGQVHIFLSHSPKLGLKLATILASRLKETTQELHRAHEALDQRSARFQRLVSALADPAAKDPELARLIKTFSEHDDEGLGVIRLSSEAPPPPIGTLESAGDDAAPAPSAEPGEAAGDKKGKKKSPVYERPVLCPCHDGEPFTAHCLLSGSLVVEANPYDVPIYVRATGNKEFVDYTLLEVQVCPRCHYAATDLSYFDDPRKGKDKTRPVELDAKAIKALHETADKRAEIAAGAGEALHGAGRGHQAALVSYLLAAETVRVLAEAHPERSAMLQIRRGNFFLKVAELYRKADMPLEEKKYLKEALAALREAYSKVEGPNLYRALFQVIALSATLGQEEAMGKYFSAFQRMKQKAAGIPEKDKAAFNLYFKRARDLWQMRQEDARDEDAAEESAEETGDAPAEAAAEPAAEPASATGEPPADAAPAADLPAPA